MSHATAVQFTVIYQSMLELSDMEIFTRIATFTLTHLSLLTASEGIELQVLFDLFDLPTLRYLQLDHPAWNNKVYLRMYWDITLCQYVTARAWRSEGPGIHRYQSVDSFG